MEGNGWRQMEANGWRHNPAASPADTHWTKGSMVLEAVWAQWWREMSLPPLVTELRFSCRPVRSLITVTTELHGSRHVNKTDHKDFFNVSWGGVRLSPLHTSTNNWPIVPAPWELSTEHLVEWESAGETKELGGNLPSATLSTINPTLLDMGSNPGSRGGKPATNRLSYGTAQNRPQSIFSIILKGFSYLYRFSLPEIQTVVMLRASCYITYVRVI
jgi:hypothetical protein